MRRLHETRHYYTAANNQRARDNINVVAEYKNLVVYD